jgi:hypothetical protein
MYMAAALLSSRKKKPPLCAKLQTWDCIQLALTAYVATLS